MWVLQVFTSHERMYYVAKLVTLFATSLVTLLRHNSGLIHKWKVPCVKCPHRYKHAIDPDWSLCIWLSMIIQLLIDYFIQQILSDKKIAMLAMKVIYLYGHSSPGQWG